MTAPRSSPALAVESLTTGYGGVEIVRTVSVRVDAGEIVTVLGPNGAGKSTLIKAIFGLLPVWAGRLSGGQRQLLALARALMAEPTLLLLDEPSAGLSPAMIEVVFDHLLAFNAGGVSLLLVEQNARQALSISERGYVLAAGENRLDGPAETLLTSDDVRRLYLGG